MTVEELMEELSKAQTPAETDVVIQLEGRAYVLETRAASLKPQILLSGEKDDDMFVIDAYVPE